MDNQSKDLRKRLKTLELQSSQHYRFSPERIRTLEELLLGVYNALCPREVDYEHRAHLVRVMDSMAKDSFGPHDGYPKVEAFGSYLMDMFTPQSDLDLSLNFSASGDSSFPRDQKISSLRKFSKILYAQQRSGKVFGVVPILRARVPVLKFADSATGIECDISVENKEGISKSLMINFLCQVDERFRTLCFLAKAWAKAQRINSPKDNTLSSLSVTLLVVLHLQTREPPILPPISSLLRDGLHPSRMRYVVHQFKHFGRANRESIAELFISFFIKLSSLRSLWEQGLCASTFEGHWIYKEWETSSIAVEDFLDKTQNCARAVGQSELSLICDRISSSLHQLYNFNNGRIRGSDLEALLFGPLSLHTRQRDQIFHGLDHHGRSSAHNANPFGRPNQRFPTLDPDINLDRLRELMPYM
ncbi:protein HESO1-like [Wolffia australiana]